MPYDNAAMTSAAVNHEPPAAGITIRQVQAFVATGPGPGRDVVLSLVPWWACCSRGAASVAPRSWPLPRTASSRVSTAASPPDRHDARPGEQNSHQLASIAISGILTTVVIAVVFVVLRRRNREAAGTHEIATPGLAG